LRRRCVGGEEPFEGAAEFEGKVLTEGRQIEVSGSAPQIPAEDHLTEKGIGSLAERKAQ
jgi:hypothetical protein